ncbi:MAG: diaminopimelate epimerase [Elusimicrobia bacterium]|nr:diaminopimelate epimerase [Elusimicrobiota bacterium]
MRFIKFVKMQAAGNDFIVFDNRKKVIKKNYSKLAQGLCRRNFSIGADGVLLIESSTTADFKMITINSDGSQANMCGNGARCAALFAYTNKISGKTMKFETGAGIIKAKVNGFKVRITLTEPKDIKLDMNLRIESREIHVSSVNSGVPHAVILSPNIEQVDIASIGRLIRNHTQFTPEGTNVDFIKVIDEHTIKIRTYERGVEAETYACGTGCVAGTIIAGLKKMVKSPVKLITSGGEMLSVHFRQSKTEDLLIPIYDLQLEGKAEVIFEGNIPHAFPSRQNAGLRR